MSEPIIVRFFKRNQQRWFNKSVVVEDLNETNDRRKLNVTYGSKSRDTGKRMHLPGFGTSRISEYAGVDKHRLEVRLQGEHLHTLPTNHEAINEYVRRMRPDDVLALQYADMAIDSLAQQLREARTKRLHFLHDAFQRAHKITVKELVELAEANDPRSKGDYDHGAPQ